MLKCISGKRDESILMGRSMSCLCTYQKSVERLISRRGKHPDQRRGSSQMSVCPYSQLRYETCNLSVMVQLRRSQIVVSTASISKRVEVRPAKQQEASSEADLYTFIRIHICNMLVVLRLDKITAHAANSKLTTGCSACQNRLGSTQIHMITLREMFREEKVHENYTG